MFNVMIVREKNNENTEVRYKGKSINDVLNMSVEYATIFQGYSSIYQKLNILNKIGLEYVRIGQPSTAFLAEAQNQTYYKQKDTGKTLYILDEPTTGLHFQDIQLLLDC